MWADGSVHVKLTPKHGRNCQMVLFLFGQFLNGDTNPGQLPHQSLTSPSLVCYNATLGGPGVLGHVIIPEYCWGKTTSVQLSSGVGNVHHSACELTILRDSVNLLQIDLLTPTARRMRTRRRSQFSLVREVALTAANHDTESAPPHPARSTTCIWKPHVPTTLGRFTRYSGTGIHHPLWQSRTLYERSKRMLQTSCFPD